MKRIILFLALIVACGLTSFAQDVRIQGQLDYNKRSKHPFFAQNVAVNVSNTLAETTVASVVIPGNSLGSNGLLRVTYLYDTDVNAAINKTVILRFGGAVFRAQSLSGQRSGITQANIWNRNNPTKQIGQQATAQASYATSIGMPATNNVDTTVDQTLALSISNVNATDSTTLHAVEVSILKFE